MWDGGGLVVTWWNPAVNLVFKIPAAFVFTGQVTPIEHGVGTKTRNNGGKILYGGGVFIEKYIQSILSRRQTVTVTVTDTEEKVMHSNAYA